jgi:hypothetical protein
MRPSWWISKMDPLNCTPQRRYCAWRKHGHPCIYYTCTPGVSKGKFATCHDSQILGQELAGKFDTVFLTTPHGLELQQLPLIYLNPYISGVASLGKCRLVKLMRMSSLADCCLFL